MAERLFVEKAFFTDTDVDIYVRNIGSIDLTLEQVDINGVLYNLSSKISLPSIENNNQITATTVTVTEPFTEGDYVISFISSRNKDLGATEIGYHKSPRILYSSLTPNQITVNSSTPIIKANVTDPNGIGDICADSSDVSGIYMTLNLEEINVTLIPDYAHNIVTVQASKQLIDGYYVVYLRVTDKEGNSVSRSWYFSVATPL